MKIVIKKPKINLSKVKLNKTNHSIANIFRYFYDFDEFVKMYLPLNEIKLLVFLLIASVITFSTYFLTSYIRADDLTINEIAKQVAFLNYAMWGAYIMFVLGINLLIVLLFRVLKIKQDDKKFLLNQITIAIAGYLFMRIVAMVIILLDEKLPFEINFEYSFFNFNLLTILFIAQISLALVIYNLLIRNLPEKMKSRKLLTMILAVIYVASLWTLTAP